MNSEFGSKSNLPPDDAESAAFSNSRRVLDGFKISGTGLPEQPLVLEPTDEPGVYDTSNAVLTTHYVNIAEVREASDEPWTSTPIDWC